MSEYRGRYYTHVGQIGDKTETLIRPTADIPLCHPRSSRPTNCVQSAQSNATPTDPKTHNNPIKFNLFLWIPLKSQLASYNDAPSTRT